MLFAVSLIACWRMSSCLYFTLSLHDFMLALTLRLLCTRPFTEPPQLVVWGLLKTITTHNEHHL